MHDNDDQTSLATLEKATLVAISPATSLNNPYIALATSDNTRRAYRHDIRHFETWGGRLPAQTAQIAQYLEAHAATFNPHTLARRLIALRHWHAYQGFADPTAHAVIQKTMKGIQRVHGKPTQKAHALTPSELVTLHQYLAQQGTLIATRDDALIQIGFFGALRGSELVGMRVEDITWHDAGIEILLPSSKTDPTHAGQRCVIKPGKETLCPIRALTDWLAKSGIEQGPIFTRIRKNDKIGMNSLNPLSVTAILKARAKQAGLPQVAQLSSHSLRRGFATSAALAGERLQTIMRDCRWKSPHIAMGYIEQADQMTDHASAKILDSINQIKT
ncbi:MAG: site-specific integrase [Gammaproteobacteria bacterium]